MLTIHLYNARSDAHGSADFEDAHTFRAEPADASVALGPRQARIHPFADHRALELCEHAKHLKHGLASRRGGVESLLVQE